MPYDATLAHPGWSRTDLQRHSLGAGLGNLMLRPFNMSAERGALTTVRDAMEAVVEPAAYFGARGLTQLAGPRSSAGTQCERGGMRTSSDCGR